MLQGQLGDLIASDGQATHDTALNDNLLHALVGQHCHGLQAHKLSSLREGLLGTTPQMRQGSTVLGSQCLRPPGWRRSRPSSAALASGP